ncbi:MAG: TetR family transcriptional regulator [Acidimicrobiales bacterium]|nr:TetR family transcriptional regulator [Acidimicrobiales bacterium]MDG1877109.1 TetR family transcriptional regulator [Acidimicrobiales bacterium]
MAGLRLSPEHRRTQLLDVAKTIMERDGVGSCTIDRVSAEAQVTAQLVHKYFGTRTSLLHALFAREDDAYETEIARRLEAAQSFEDVVRLFVTANVDLLSPATAIGQLRGLPEFGAARAERERSSRASAQKVLTRSFRLEHRTTDHMMEFVLRLGSAASVEAATITAQRGNGERTAHIERTVRFILAGIRELANEPIDVNRA